MDAEGLLKWLDAEKLGPAYSRAYEDVSCLAARRVGPVKAQLVAGGQPIFASCTHNSCRMSREMSRPT